MSPVCRCRWFFMVLLLCFVLYENSVAFSDYSVPLCNYTAGVLRISNSNTTEAKHCIKQFRQATQLYYTRSNLVVIPSYINILKKLKFLDLSSNSLSEANFNDLDYKICSNLEAVSLDYNNITVLRRGSLDCFINIEHFSIRNNSMTVIENGTFSDKLDKITHIDITYNKLTELDTSLVARVKSNDSIRITVNASWNSISSLTNSYNVTINDISRKTMIYLVALHNNATTVNTPYYSKMFNVTNTKSLFNLWNSGFDFRFNPFICDCGLYKLAMLLRQFYVMDPDNPVFMVTCGYPQSLKGKLIREVNLNDFNCSVTKHCPLGCDCILTINLDLVTVRCGYNYDQNELPLYCPSATALYIDMKTDNLQRLSDRTYMRNVTTLDVSGCGISSIHSSIIRQMESIPYIYLYDNKLAYIPTSFKTFNFSDGQTMTIYGNPFICDCHTLWMKKWLIQNNRNIAYEDKTLCASGPGRGVAIVNVPDSDFICTIKLSVYVIVAIVAVCIVCLIIVSVIFNRYQTHVQVWLISNFDICKYCCRKRTTNEFTYDIFVSHSCDDDDDVHKIVRLLEKHSPPYKVCLGERDFPLGKTIAENIIHTIQTSHTTLLIVSNNFLRSSWCNMEFREAHMRFLKDRDINLILVVLEELDKSLINLELESYMESHVYIKYKDKRFFARLLVNLPVIINEGTSETSPLLGKSTEQ